MNVSAATNLKAKFIEKFDNVRANLYQGVKIDCTLLKYMVCVINDSDSFDYNTYEFLMNYV